VLGPSSRLLGGETKFPQSKRQACSKDIKKQKQPFATGSLYDELLQLSNSNLSSKQIRTTNDCEKEKVKREQKEKDDELQQLKKELIEKSIELEKLRRSELSAKKTRRDYKGKNSRLKAQLRDCQQKVKAYEQNDQQRKEESKLVKQMMQEKEIENEKLRSELKTLTQAVQERDANRLATTRRRSEGHGALAKRRHHRSTTVRKRPGDRTRILPDVPRSDPTGLESSDDDGDCSIEPEPVSSATNDSETLPFDKDDYEYLCKHYLEKRIRTGDDAQTSGGMVLRQRQRPSILDSSPDEQYKRVKQRIDQLKKAKNDRQIYHFLCQLRDSDVNRTPMVFADQQETDEESSNEVKVLLFEDLEHDVIEVDHQETGEQSSSNDEAEIVEVVDLTHDLIEIDV